MKFFELRLLNKKQLRNGLIMYNYTVYVKRLNDNFKKQEHTKIVDSTISNAKWQQQCNSTDTNTPKSKFVWNNK